MATRKDTCSIWGPDYEATVYQGESRLGDGGIDETAGIVKIDSDRAGGAFEISRDAQPSVRVLGDSEKARLTTWLVDQRTQGIGRPLVTKKIVEYTSNKRPLPVFERAERLLRFIAKQADAVGAEVLVREDTQAAALAWSESTDWGEVIYFFEYLKEMGWLGGTGFIGGGFRAIVTVEGHARVAEQVANTQSFRAFVAMWIDDSMNDAFEVGIRPAIEAAGYEPVRIDKEEHIRKIDDEIIAEIRRSRFLVADFTQDSDGARGSVYYEAGFAHALGIPVIFTCRGTSLKDLHFDTEHYNHIVWTDEDELCEKLKNRILAVIGEGPSTFEIPGG